MSEWLNEWWRKCKETVQGEKEVAAQVTRRPATADNGKKISEPDNNLLAAY